MREQHLPVSESPWISTGRKRLPGRLNRGKLGAARTERYLAEGHQRRFGVTIRMLVHPAPEFRVGGRLCRFGLLGNRRELLADAALDGRVVSFEAQQNALAIENLVANIGFD